jgi:hypothetical protein
VSDQSWKKFIIECPALFDDVFKSFVNLNDNNLAKYYDTIQVDPANINTLVGSKSPHDYGYLYKDMVFSDVELEVGGQVLKAHKVILMNRSSVFKAMFSHDTLEAAKNRVIIKDFDFEIFQELLRYIYCEKVENLEAVALDLMAAADYVRFSFT